MRLLTRVRPFKKIVWGAVFIVSIAGQITASGQGSGRRSAEFPIVTPTRKSTEAAPVVLPSLPPEAGQIEPLALEVRVRVEREGAATIQEQTVSRTADRVHMKVRNGAEWLYLQNSVDRRRVHAYLIDHEHQALIRYDESELRNHQQIRGWLDVLTLGFDPTDVGRLTPTGRTEAVERIPFSQHVSETVATGIREVWWSAGQLLALRIVSSDARQTRTVSIERIRPGADPTVLASPELRFPSYRSVDLAEWLEDR